MATAKGFIENTDRAIIGVDKFHYSVQKLDRPDFILYGDMNEFPNLITATATPSAVEATLYADNKAVIQFTGVGNIAVSIEMASIPNDVLADLTGSPVVGAVKHTSGDQASPYVGIAWRQLYNNGEYNYVKLFKGQFQEPENTTTTKGDSVEFQTKTMTGTFVSTSYQGLSDGGKSFSYLMAVVDEADPNYNDEGETWFDAIHESAAPKWVTATKYARGAIVSNESKIYTCITPHTSGATFAADVAKWKELSF